jgi:hypothetical protein
MNARHRVTLIAMALLLPLSAAETHHAFAPVYDIKSTVSVEGTVTEFRLVNPHASVTLDSVDSNGQVTTWTVDFDGRVNLAVGGWTDDTIKAGEVVTVTGNRAHSGAPKMFFIRLVRSDGSELLRPLFERFDSIDEQRRQRAQQRDADN